MTTPTIPPLVIQKVANGVLIFPAWALLQGSLDLTIAMAFSEFGHPYSSTTGSASGFLSNLYLDPETHLPASWRLAEKVPQPDQNA